MHEPAPPPNSNKAPGSAANRPETLDIVALSRHARRLATAAEPPWLHAEVARRMAERLVYIKQPPQSLWDVSAWLGASSEALRAAYPECRQFWQFGEPALAVRSQAALLRPWWQAWRRGVRPVWSDAAEPAGLVWANLLLHACSDLPGTLKDWHQRLAVEGFVMFSCFGPDSFIELRSLFTRQGWGRTAPAWWDMHDLGDLLAQAGFADPVMDQERLRLTWADSDSLLADLRALGGNLAPDRFAGLRGRRWRAELHQALESLRDREGRLALTVELVYGHAFKAAPRLKMAAETRVSVDEMKAVLRGSGKV